MTSPTKMETMKKDMLGLRSILEENEIGGRSFRKCAKCNRLTFGHERPGPGMKRCTQPDAVSNEDSF